MPHFSPEFIERVRSSNDIIDVIGASLPLKRAGTNFVALCPFHSEKSPSFNVSPQRQIFHCFGCHAGGDIFGFIQKYENLSFVESVERLAERAQIPLEHETNPNAARQRGLKDQLLRLHEAICTRWQNCLANEAAGQVARDYLQRRGVSPDSIREFRIGAAPEAWDDTVNWAKRNDFDPTLCEQAGLVVRKEDSKHWYDRFRGRLMFPICDEQGRVIAFSGRILQGDEKIAKYVNSPETPLFTKGRVLFALDKAKRPILEAGHAIVCEGQLDAIACHAAGVRNVIAPQGTALTQHHARILKRYVNEVILCFDGDKAGRAATIRSVDDCLGTELAIRVASIPEPDDPDSFLKKQGPDAFRALLAGAKGFFDFYLQNLITEHPPDTDRGRMAIIVGMGAKLVLTGNAVLVDTYAQRTAQRLGVSVESVRSEFRKERAIGAQRTEPDTEEAIDPSETHERPSSQDLWLLRYLCEADTALLDWAAAHLDPAWLVHPVTRRIVENRLHQAGCDTQLTVLLDALQSDPFACQLVTEAASEQRPITDVPTQLADLTLRLRNSWIDRQIAQLGTRLSDPAHSHQDQLRILQEQQQWRAARRLPLSPRADT